MKMFTVSLILCFFAFTLSSIASAQIEPEPTPNGEMMQHLMGSNTQSLDLFGDNSERFGMSVSMSGNRAAISAPNERNSQGMPTGAVYIFEYNDETGWVETHRLAPEMFNIGGYYYRLKLDGDVLMIGGFGEDPEAGTVEQLLFFRKSGNDWLYEGYVIPENCNNNFALSTPTLVQNPSFIREGCDRLINYLEGKYNIIVDDYQWSASKPITNFDIYKMIDSAWVFQSSFQTESGHIASQYMEGSLIETLYTEGSIISSDGKEMGFLVDTPRSDGYYVPSHFEFWRYNGNIWQKYQEIQLPVDPTDSQTYWNIEMRDSSMLLKKIYGSADQEIKKVVQVYKKLNGLWVLHSELMLMNDPETADAINGSSEMEYTQIVLSGQNVIVTVTTDDKMLVFAFHIPDIDQTVERVRGGINAASDTPLALPLLGEETAEQHDGYTRFNVNLTTRPYKKPVHVKLTAPDGVVLDNGNKTAKILTLTFTPENWYLPQVVTARSTSSSAGTRSIIIRENFLKISSTEYRKVRPMKVRVNIHAQTFEMVSPAPAAIINGQPEMVWRPYGLATDYQLVMKNKKGAVVWKKRVAAVDVCAEICVYTPTDAPTKTGKYRWRVIAIDSIGEFKLSAPWRGFTQQASLLGGLGK